MHKAPPAVETVVAEMMKKSGSFNNALGVNSASREDRKASFTASRELFQVYFLYVQADGGFLYYV